MTEWKQHKAYNGGKRFTLDKVKWRQIAKFANENMSKGPSDHRVGMAIIGAYSIGYDAGLKRGLLSAKKVARS